MMSFILTILMVLYKIPLINLLGDKGMGYYSIDLIIYLFLTTCFFHGLSKALATLLVSQTSKGQHSLAYKTIISSFIYAIIIGGTIAVLLFFCADMIAAYLFNAQYSSYTIRALSPCLFVVPVSGVLHGTYIATKGEHISKCAHNIERIFVMCLSILGVYIFTGIGIDEAKLKNETLYEQAYSSMGAALGLTIGVSIACIFLLIIFVKYRKKLLRLAEHDKESKDNLHSSKKQLVFLLIKTLLPFTVSSAIYYFSNLIDYSVFNHIMDVQGHKENSYIILLGMLNGKYDFFISIPLIIVNFYSVSKVPVLINVARNGSNRKLHIKISQSLRYTMLYIIPCTVFYIIHAKPLMNLIFSGINDTPAILLKTGSISLVFYSLAAISNAALNAIDEWKNVAKNVFISVVIQLISLLIMMIIFQWNIIALVISHIIFAACIFILNEHSLRERIGYVQEHKRTFMIPLISSIIMGGSSLVLYIILCIFASDKISVLLTLLFSVPIYILALVFMGGITQREMYRIPGGKFLAPLCKKLHLIK